MHVSGTKVLNISMDIFIIGRGLCDVRPTWCVCLVWMMYDTNHLIHDNMRSICCLPICHPFPDIVDGTISLLFWREIQTWWKIHFPLDSTPVCHIVTYLLHAMACVQFCNDSVIVSWMRLNRNCHRTENSRFISIWSLIKIELVFFLLKQMTWHLTRGKPLSNSMMVKVADVYKLRGIQIRACCKCRKKTQKTKAV